MPELNTDLSASGSLRPTAGVPSTLDNDEWAKIQQRMKELEEAEDRKNIVSQPDVKVAPDEAARAVVKSNYDAHRWVPPRTLRLNQDPQVVRGAIMDASRDMVDKGRITQESQKRLQKLLNDRRMSLTQRDLSWLSARAVEAAQRDYGPMWDKVLSKEGTASLLGNAMVQAIGESAVINGLESEGPGIWESVWHQQQGLMRRPDLIRHGKDFYNLMKTYQGYRTFVETEGYYAPHQYRGAHINLDEVHRLYAAVTGAAYAPVKRSPADYFKGLNEALDGFAKGTAWTHQKAKAIVPLEMLGFSVPPENVDDRGRIPAGAIPFNDASSHAFYRMLSRGWSMTHPEAMAEYKTLTDLRDGLFMRPDTQLKELFGHSWPEAVQELEREPNQSKRMYRFLQQINPKTYGTPTTRRQNDWDPWHIRNRPPSKAQAGGKLGQLFQTEQPNVDDIMEQHALKSNGFALAAAAKEGEDLIGKYQAWKKNRYTHWLAEQEKIPADLIQTLKEEVTPELVAAARADTVKEWNKAYKLLDHDPKRFFQENNVPFKFLTFVLNAVGHAAETMKTRNITDPILQPWGKLAMNHLLDPLPGDDMLVGQREVPLDYVIKPPENRNVATWMANKLMWGHTPQEQWEHMYARHLDGRANLGDDITVAVMAMRDFGADLPGALYEDPVGMYVLGKVLGKYSKGVKKVATKAERAGIPRPLVGLMELAAEPMHPIKAMDTMFGVYGPAIDGLRASVGEFQRMLNKSSKTAPELISVEKARVGRFLDMVEERGLHPQDSIRTLRAVHADAMAKLQMGERLPWIEAKDILQQALEMPTDLARNILPPPLQGPVALRAPGKMLWEMDQVVAELEKMDNQTAKALKEGTGKTYAEHVGETWNAWYTRPEAWMPKRKAFYQALEAGVGSWLTPETAARLKAGYDKHVEWDRRLPAAAKEFRDAMVSKAELRQDFHSMTRLHAAAAKHAEVDIKAGREQLQAFEDRMKRLEEREAYLSYPVEHIMERENYLRSYLAHEAGVELPTTITPQVIGTLRADVKKAKATQAEAIRVKIEELKARQVDLNKYIGAYDDMTTLLQQGFDEFTQIKGVEAGYKNPLTKAQRLEITERHLLPLLDALGREAKGEGVPANLAAADMVVTSAVKAGHRALGDKITPEVAEAQIRAARVAELSKKEYWDIPEMGEYHRNMIQSQRELIRDWRSSAATDDVRFRIFQVAMADKYPNFKGAHINEIVQGMISDQTPMFNMAKKLKDKYWTQLTDKDRKLLSRALTDPELAASQPLTSHVMSLYQELEGFRHTVLEESYRSGRITLDEFERYSEGAYVERYYADNVFSQELAEQGYKSKMPPAQRLPEANRPNFNAFRAQRSTQYARVFYKDRKTGKLLEHQEGVVDNGSAKLANKAAQRWLEDKIKSGEIEKHHAIEMGKKGSYVVKVLTDQEMGGMGLVDNVGLFRVNRLEEILRDNMKRRLLTHVGQMRGLVRNPVKDGSTIRPEGVEQEHWGEWTQPLEGKEWGALQGKMVQRSLIRTMNTLDSYGEYLQAVRDQFINESGAMKVMTGLDKALAFRFRNLSKDWWVARHGDKLIKSVYHNMIVKNWETWLTNHVGNWFSFALMGLNPSRPTAINSGLKFHRLMRASAEYNLVRGGGLPGMWKALEAEFGPQSVAAFQRMMQNNMLAPTVGSEHIGVRGAENPGMRRMRDFIRRVEIDHEKSIARSRARVEEMEQAIALAEQEIEFARDPKFKAEDKLSDTQLQDTINRVERWKKTAKALRSKMYREWSANPLWRQVAARKKEALNFFFNVDESVAARYLSEAYGKIDAMYKFMAVEEMIRKGVPMDQAIGRVENLMQNYNKVPSWVKSLKSAPLLGPMVPSFAYEAGRIMKNAFTKYPGQAMAVYNFPLIWNMSALAARGMTVDDFLTVDSSENRAQAYMKLWTRMFIPTKDGTAQLYTGKYTFSNVLENPAGVHRLFGREMQTKLDQAFGPGPAMLMSGAANFLSNFIGANPFLDAGVEYATGADTFDKTITYGAGPNVSVAKNLADRIAQLWIPRTIVSAGEELSSSHEESQITGHKRRWFQTLLRIATGVSLTERKDTEAIGLLALKYSRWEQMADLYKRMKSEDKVELKDTAVRARRHLDAGEFEEYEKELESVKKLIAKGKDRLLYHSGKWIALESTPEEVAQQAINYAGRDVLGVIQNVPIDLVPDFFTEIALSGYRKAAPKAVRHLERQMTDWHFVQGYSNAGQLRQALSKVADYQSRFATGDPELGDVFATARFWLNLRLRQLEPQQLPAAEATLQKMKALEADLADDPVAKRRAIQRMIEAENRATAPSQP